MNKCHHPIAWNNRTAPAINQTNLGQYDNELDTLDDRIISLDTSKASQSDLLSCVSGVTYNTTTGVITFTWKNGTTYTIDLDIEKIPVSFSMSAAGVITMTTADGTTYTADVSTILKLYTFVDSDIIQFNVTQNGNNYTVTATIINGSITGEKLQPNYLADCQTARNGAVAAVASCDADKLAAEGYANGTQDGVPVTSSSPYFHNNSKYWKEQAEAVAIPTTLSSLTDVGLSNLQDGQTLKYDATLGEWINVSGTGIEELNDIPDVNISSPTNNQVLGYNNTSHKWENMTPPTPSQSLSALSDTTISTPTGTEVLQYDNTDNKWKNGKKLPFDLAINNGAYGYINGSNSFVAFKSQADIDAAVAAAKVGNAASGDVLSGKTFTNSTTSGVTGSMTNNGAVDETLDTTTTSYTVPEGYHDGTGTVAISTQTKSATPATSAQTVTPDTGKVLSSVTVDAVETQTKSATPSTTAQTITPDSGKFLSSVSVGAIQTQTKSVTPTTSAQTVTPDSGKYLTSVSVGTQAHSGTFTASSRSASLDMGATHNYRYVDTTGVPGSSTLFTYDAFEIFFNHSSSGISFGTTYVTRKGYSTPTGQAYSYTYNPAYNNMTFATSNGTVSLLYNNAYTHGSAGASYGFDWCTYKHITFKNTSGSKLYVSIGYIGQVRWNDAAANTPCGSDMLWVTHGTVNANGSLTLYPLDGTADSDYSFAGGGAIMSNRDWQSIPLGIVITTQVVP